MSQMWLHNRLNGKHRFTKNNFYKSYALKLMTAVLTIKIIIKMFYRFDDKIRDFVSAELFFLSYTFWLSIECVVRKNKY